MADVQTFSKTSCPGSRLGWFTSSPLFIERLTRATEAGTQAPSGFATALTTTLLQTWGFDGYVRWLRGIKATYRMRKTWICDTFEDVFHLEFEEAGSLVSNPSVLDVGMNLGKGVTCYAKPKTGTVEAKWDEKRGLTSKRGPALVSFIPPTGESSDMRRALTSQPACSSSSACTSASTQTTPRSSARARTPRRSLWTSSGANSPRTW